MLDPQALSELGLLAGWGPLESPPESVSGGLMHRVYRVRAGGGAFAVKAIDPTVATYDGIRERLRRAERIASAVASSGLSAVPAMEIAGETVHEVGAGIFLVFPWVEGKVLPSGSAGPDAGRIVGDLIGRVHALDLAPEGETSAPGGERKPEAWEAMLDEADAQSAAWAAEARAALPDLHAWGDRAYAARWELGRRRRVVSHGDLDQKNVLWSDETTPWMIDWESAGPVSPAKETVAAALDWSGHGEDVATFGAVLRAYRIRADLSADEARLGLDASFDLGWLEFSMRRSLGLAGSDPRERAIGDRETPSTLRALRTLAAHLEGLDRACGS